MLPMVMTMNVVDQINNYDGHQFYLVFHFHDAPLIQARHKVESNRC